MLQDGFVQAEGIPDPSELQRQDQQPSGHFMEGKMHRKRLHPATWGRLEERSHAECNRIGMRGGGEVRQDGRGGHMCEAENPGSGIVPGSVGSGSWVLRLGDGPHPRLVTQFRLSQEAAFVRGLDRKPVRR